MSCVPVLSEGRPGLEPQIGEDVDPVDYPLFQPRPQLITNRIIELVLFGELRSRDADCRAAGYRERCWDGAVHDKDKSQLVSLTATLYSYWIPENSKKLVPNHFNLSIVKYDY